MKILNNMILCAITPPVIVFIFELIILHSYFIVKFYTHLKILYILYKFCQLKKLVKIYNIYRTINILKYTICQKLSTIITYSIFKYFHKKLYD